MVFKGLCLSQSTSLYHLFIALAIGDGDDIVITFFSPIFLSSFSIMLQWRSCMTEVIEFHIDRRNKTRNSR